MERHERAPITSEQQTAAKVVGSILLLAMAAAMVAELYALRDLTTPEAAETARRVIAASPRFRLGIVLHLLTFASDAGMAAALYVVLAPVNRGLALLGAFWRLADAVVGAMACLAQAMALRILSSPHYLDPLGTVPAQSLARLLLAARDDAMSFTWVFLGLGSTVFALLWLRSRYIPRVLAAWGVFASLLLAAAPLVDLLSPSLGKAIGLAYMMPMFFYEVPLGLWLLLRGLSAEGRKTASHHS
jgi:hypothetical protein